MWGNWWDKSVVDEDINKKNSLEEGMHVLDAQGVVLGGRSRPL